MSRNFSFEGWSFFEWLKGNLSTLKEILKIGLPFVFGLSFFRDNPALIALVTAIGKLALDSIHYFLAEQ